MPLNGYFHVFLVNASSKPVNFDNMTVNVIKANVVQQMDYYPFGLMYQKQDVNATNNLLWHHSKELQENEFAQQGKSLDLEDFGARMYDPVVARWWCVDPMADHPKQLGMSSYSAFWNNPINQIDKDGKCPDCPPEIYVPIAEHVYDANVGDKTANGWEVLFVDENEKTGYKGALYQGTYNGKTEYIYATAGTDDPADAVEDLTQITGNSNQYWLSVGYAAVWNEYYKGVSFTGHSLGGGLASANALSVEGKAVTFNAAGISGRTKDDLKIKNKKADITAYVVEGEAISHYQGKLGLKAEGNIITLSAWYVPELPLIYYDDYYRLYQRAQNHKMSTVIEKFNAQKK